MSHLETQIALVLQERAGSDVHIERLLDAARRAGRRRQRCQRLVAGAAGTAVLAVVAVVTLTVTAGAQTRLPSPDAGADWWARVVSTLGPSAPVPQQYRALPVADGATSADRDAAAVGDDRLLLHFEVDPATLPANPTTTVWTTVPDQEQLTLNFDETRSLTVRLANTPDGLDPQPGKDRRTVRMGTVTGTIATGSTLTSPTRYLVWQPRSGVWAGVQGQVDDDTLLAVGAGLRLDRVHRCVVPFRLTAVVTAGSVVMCSTYVTSAVALGELEVGLPNPPRVTVGTAGTAVVTVQVPGERITKPTQYINGRPATVADVSGASTTLEVRIDFGDRTATVDAQGDFDRSTVLALAEGLRMADAATPAGWPTDPLP